jgi:hypothetical protein
MISHGLEKPGLQTVEWLDNGSQDLVGEGQTNIFESLGELADMFYMKTCAACVVSCGSGMEIPSTGSGL